ncbi:MAG: GlxA family transcriptional regulator [Rhizobiaceae bacterium]
MAPEPVRVTFLLVSGFMMTAYVIAVDALRLANWREGRRLFEWEVRTADNSPAEASNGMVVAPDRSLEANPLPEAVFVCAGFSVERGFSNRTLSWLRALDRKKITLGGWDTGPLLLAEAGLMDGKRMALHWQAAPVVRDQYPRVEINSEGCQIDSRRFTGPGGISTFELMIAFIEQKANSRVAQMVAKSANWNLDTVSDRKYFHTQTSPKLARILAMMEREVSDPPSIPSLAQHAGLSVRQLNRLFQQHLHSSAHRFFLSLRLQHAYELLRQSEMPVSDIASACGFTSISRFCQAFRTEIGATPTQVRRRPRWLQLEAGNETNGLVSTLLDEKRISTDSVMGSNQPYAAKT